MKKITTYVAFMFLFVSLYGQNTRNSNQTQRNFSTSEVTGKIPTSELMGLSDSNKFISIDNNKYLINSGTIISGQFVKSRTRTNHESKSRVRVFYRIEDNVNIATKVVEEKFLVPNFRLVLPVGSYIPPTAISGIGMGNQSGIGKITTFGYGVGAEARVYANFRLFFDFTNYSYKQDLAAKGSTNVSVHINEGYFINLPFGAKYTTTTASIRLGVKYVVFREKNIQPWVGVGYSINIWKAQYEYLDESRIYGKANGATWRSSVLAGIDIKMLGSVTFTIFAEAISPVANYTMDLPAFGGTYSSFEGMTYPTPRFGISLGGF